MEFLASIMILSQLIFTFIAGLYFYQNLKGNKHSEKYLISDSKSEIAKLNLKRSIKLTEPLAEKIRPKDFDQIIGQEQGLAALRAALCSPNPQHVIIYGPPGVGKTAAARLALDEAKKLRLSPFGRFSKFIEVDATTLQFDERNIADPLLGSVHDPIYQGAGAYGAMGIPRPKPGAVTKAHGGVLFIDEIGELHPIQLNRLLKVLEDRVVKLNSVYYSPSDKNIPAHIHDIFKNGFPADFRLVGATTKSPDELPSALRSRCAEIFFKPLNKEELEFISENAINNSGFKSDLNAGKLISKYAANGRDCVNIVQMAASMASVAGRESVLSEDIENVVEFGRYSPKMEHKLTGDEKIGVANGLAVSGICHGQVLTIEATAEKAKGKGELRISGMIEEEELSSRGGRLKRQSTAKSSVYNSLTLLENLTNVNWKTYNIHINFPGGMPVDGPSAGVAIFVALYSAIFKIPVPSKIAITGEVSIHGKVCPVGGVYDKIEAAHLSGAELVIVPSMNKQNIFDKIPVEVKYAESISQVLETVFKNNIQDLQYKPVNPQSLAANVNRKIATMK